MNHRGGPGRTMMEFVHLNLFVKALCEMWY